MKKRLLLLLLCLTLLLTGCAAGKEQMPVFRIYGLSDTPGSDAISAVTMDWSGQKSLTVDQQAQAALEQLLGGCTEPGYRSPIPQGVQLRSCQLTGGMALVDFSQGYEQLSGIDLTMADYCVTLTLSQLPGVSVVRITVEGQELAYRSHSLLRSQDLLMTSEDDRVRAERVQRISRRAVDDAELRADVLCDLGRMLLRKLQHPDIRDYQRVGLHVLQKFKILRERGKLVFARERVAGHVYPPPHRMRKLHRFAQLLLVEVARRGAHPELSPRQIHGVRAVMERNCKALHIPGGG